MGKGEGDEGCGGKKGRSSSSSSSSMSSFWTIFMHADATDVMLMTMGFIGAVGDGLSMPTMLYMTSKIFNNFGNGPSALSVFTDTIDKVTYASPFFFSSLSFGSLVRSC